MQWTPFEHDGKTYELDHLHPRTCYYRQPAKGDRPERSYRVTVIFSLHCFTRGFKPGETPDGKLCYSSERETRIFDFRRYELSKGLPAIFDALEQRKCYHTGKNNFLTIDWIDERGNSVEYEIFFEASRSSRKGVVNLFVQSAYIRDAAHKGSPHRKPIGLHVILFNVLNNKPIKPPQ